MYRIIMPDGVTHTVEKPKYIKVHENGCYVLCDHKNAEGVAYNNNPYMFADGILLQEIDGGMFIDELLTENAILRQQLIDAEEALIELYEVTNNG